MDLILVRHGLPLRVDPGATAADPALGPEGEQQARALAGWLADERIDLVVQSPARRAVETAAPLAEACGLAPRTVEELAEWDWGSDSYIPYEEMKAAKDDRWAALSRGEPWDPTVDIAAFRARTLQTMEHLIADSPGRRVAVVCHAGVINSYVGQVLGIERLLWFQPDYTSITRVAASRGGRRGVVSLNETAHLRGVFADG